jgi:hypothetical protein
MNIAMEIHFCTSIQRAYCGCARKRFTLHVIGGFELAVTTMFLGYAFVQNDTDGTRICFFLLFFFQFHFAPSFDTH